jgi:hypothetical protein
MSMTKKKCEKCGAECGICEYYTDEESMIEHWVCKAHRTIKLDEVARGELL